MKQPQIHQNLLGKKELVEFIDTFEKIQSGKIKYNAAEADAFRRKNKIGEYREWEFDIKRIEQIQAQVKDGEIVMHPEHRLRYPRGTKQGKSGPREVEYNTKLKRKAEEKALIHELENL